MILKGCAFFNEFFEKEYGDIKIEDGRIKEIGILPEDGKDMSGKIVIPGFIDIHIHGAAGGDAGDKSDKALNKMGAFLAKKGVTSFCPTTMTDSIDSLCEQAKVIAKCKTDGAKIVGINFEGPFISKEKRGSQNEKYIIPGTREAFDRLYDSAKGLMKLTTVAPEAFDSDDFISYASKKCVVSIGHTACDDKECKRALEHGASHFTHLFNAMTQMKSREPGTVGMAFDSNAACELICDGHHISPVVLRNAFKILGGDRAVVVSDSMRASGLKNGEYPFGGHRVYVDEKDGVARLSDGTIAASITNIYDEFKNLLSFGIDFKTVLKSCTINPAKVIGEDKNIGSIAVGKCADLVVLDENLNIEEVYINGTLA